MFGGSYPAALNFNRTLQPLRSRPTRRCWRETTVSHQRGGDAERAAGVHRDGRDDESHVRRTGQRGGNPLLATVGGDITLSGAVSNAAGVTLTAGGNVSCRATRM